MELFARQGALVFCLLVNGLIVVEEFQEVLVDLFFISRNIFVVADCSSLFISVVNTIKLL